LIPYRSLIEYTKEHRYTSDQANNNVGNNNIHLYVGFIPRSFAKQLMREKELHVIKSASSWLPPDLTSFQESEFLNDMFESMISGRSLYSYHRHKQRRHTSRGFSMKRKNVFSTNKKF
ncbi:MAG: hypothetical protein ACREOZ_04455, partial [Gloeomargaritales cyanobacterium]